jgi:hypothetical protein
METAASGASGRSGEPRGFGGGGVSATGKSGWLMETAASGASGRSGEPQGFGGGGVSATGKSGWLTETAASGASGRSGEPQGFGGGGVSATSKSGWLMETAASGASGRSGEPQGFRWWWSFCNQQVRVVNGNRGRQGARLLRPEVVQSGWVRSEEREGSRGKSWDNPGKL